MSLPAHWIYLLSKLLQGIFHKSDWTYTKYNILHIIVEKNEGKDMCLFNRKSESCSLVNKVCIQTVYVSIKLQPTLSHLLSYWIVHVYIHVYMYIHLSWRIPGEKEPGELQPIVSHRIRHNWSDLVKGCCWTIRREILGLRRRIQSEARDEAGSLRAFV